MEKVLPFFKSHYSIGRSILTLEKPDEGIEGGPDSIIKLCKDHDLKEFYLIEDSMSGFLQAYVNSTENKIKLNFGLRLNVCQDLTKKEESALKETCKFIVFAKNKSGYERLVKIYSKAYLEGFYYYPRADYEMLKEMWSDKDLILCVPFYDSFLHRNTLMGYNCIPDFSFTKPVFCIEDNSLPFDHLILNRVNKYAKKEDEKVKTQSIYYAKKDDFKAYLTFRCIDKRTTLDKPNFDHMCSDEFCFEKWKEKSDH